MKTITCGGGGGLDVFKITGEFEDSYVAFPPRMWVVWVFAAHVM